MATSHEASSVHSSGIPAIGSGTMVFFALELVALVLDNLDDDLHSLCASSLVCWSWHGAATRLLFRTVVIPIPDGKDKLWSVYSEKAYIMRGEHRRRAVNSAITMHEIFSASPPLVRHVRHVVLKGDSVENKSVMDETMMLVCEVLKIVLRNFSSVESIKLSNHISTTILPWELIGVLLQHSSLKRVQVSRTSMMGITSTFQHLLAYGLQELSFIDVQYKDLPVGSSADMEAYTIPCAPLVFRVGKLTLDNSDRKGMGSNPFLLCGALESASFLDVKKLVMAEYSLKPRSIGISTLLGLACNLQELELMSGLSHPSRQNDSLTNRAAAIGALARLRKLRLHYHDFHTLGQNLALLLSAIRPPQHLDDLCIRVWLYPPPRNRPEGYATAEDWDLLDRTLNAGHLAASIREVTFRMSKAWHWMDSVIEFPDLLERLPMLGETGRLVAIVED